ncbi:hypothetical protein [Burkholderia ubonensis]|uniref:hypothetical protein n=1 Tax=Burkholderia ubonensis TaxID=101571 RepID=UPI000A5AD49C|nr:hypothetical protein [Burkholderia ubonensis]
MPADLVLSHPASPSLGESLALASASLDACDVELFALPSDPFHLDLPALHGSGQLHELNPATLRAIASLYLEAELEQAGVILAAELLAQSRNDLPLRSVAAARKLQSFADDSRQQLSRDDRDRLFVRLFGIGHGSADAPPGLANHVFERLMLGVCDALQVATAPAALLPGGGIALPAARLQNALGLLLDDLAVRQFGNTLAAGRRIDAALRAAIALLTDPGIQEYFGSSGLWDTLRRIYRELTPDLGRIVTRGQAGMHLLRWIADHPALLAHDHAMLADAARLREGATYAAQWLAASGLLDGTQADGARS